MNNIVKSVVFAAVVLFAGIATMQVIYKNQDPTSDITAVEPASGEAAAPSDATVEAQKEAIDAEAEAAKEAVEANVEAAKDEVEATADSAEAAAEAVEEGADAQKDAIDAEADAAKEEAEKAAH